MPQMREAWAHSSEEKVMQPFSLPDGAWSGLKYGVWLTVDR